MEKKCDTNQAPEDWSCTPLLYIHDCVVMHIYNSIIKFTDDTTVLDYQQLIVGLITNNVVGLITNNDEKAYII
jgi:hypothetical protein